MSTPYSPSVPYNPHHKRTKSACLPVRPARSPRHSFTSPSPEPGVANTTGSNTYSTRSPAVTHRSVYSSLSSPQTVSVNSPPRPICTPPPPLSTSPVASSFSGYSFHSSQPSLSGSHPSLVPQSPPVSRPHSLYVPFVGCVDAPRVPPGQAARDILHALSFAPTHESFSSIEDFNSQPPLSPCSRMRSYRGLLSLSSNSPRLRSKSSSLASLVGPVSPKLSKRMDSYCSPLSNSAHALVQRHSSPTYSPSHPHNNCENSCLKVSHPPVIHPPPDLVQMATSTPGPLSRMSSSSYSSSSGSGWDTARSTQSSHSPIVPRSSQSPLMFDYQAPSNLLQSAQLEMIRESSPYHSS